jgi:hypothetical protein
LDHIIHLCHRLSIVLRPLLCHCIGSFSELALLFFSWMNISEDEPCLIQHYWCNHFAPVFFRMLHLFFSWIHKLFDLFMLIWDKMNTSSELEVACCFNLYDMLFGFILYFYMWICWCKLIQVLQSCLKDPDKKYQEKVDALLRAWETLASYTDQSSPRDNVDYLTENLYR